MQWYDDFDKPIVVENKVKITEVWNWIWKKQHT